MTALTELRDKVAAGEFPGGMNEAARQVFPYTEDTRDDNGLKAAEAFEGSLDAALALMDAVLPRWSATIQSEGLCYVHSFEGEHSASASTPARALLLAILDALIAQEAE